jgi:hypothetical protein
MTRIDQVQAKLAASVDGEGKPRKGFKGRVAACQAELGRLSAARVASGTEIQGLTQGSRGA